MRKLLATAVAIAPLMAATGVQAEVVISTNRTTPITTSNATGSGADIIRIANNGFITVTSGSAITIDSSHNVRIDNGGTINMLNAADGATAVHVLGGNTADLTIAGVISVTDSIESYTDADKDGDIDGPWATGSGRYGVRVDGAAPLTGNILMESTMSMLVEGNNSYGVSVETDLIGNLTNLGNIRVAGDNSMGIRATGAISGNAYIGGTVSVSGANAAAASFTGDIGGRLSIQGDLTSSGYRYTGRLSDEFIANLEPEDLLQNRSAVIVGASVAGGVVFDRPPTDNDTNNSDEDGDGVTDVQEGTARVNAYGAAPAVLVASDNRDITLGVVGTGANAYGFINRGSITGQGVYDGITGNAVRFGLDGAHAVTIDGGISNEGTIASIAYEADSTAIRLANGVSTPTFVTSGAITAASSSEAATNVTALLIEAGASLPSFTNSGQFLASSGGGGATVTGILDLSGTLTSITNTRSMQANLAPNEDGDPLTGSTAIIDVRANTTGVTILQDGELHDATGTDPDTDGDGVPDSYEPNMVGAILLGSGADTVDIRNGLVLSDIAFGDGADNLSITGGAIVRGALSDTDGLLDIAVANGTLDARQASRIDVTSLNIGADGTLIALLDPASGNAAGFNVSGTATLADGAGLGVRFGSLIDTPERFTIIQAGTLNYGAIDLSSLENNSSYLFVVDASADVGAGEVYIDARRRTSGEIGMIGVEASAFDAFYAALDRDSGFLSAFMDQTDRDGFLNLYEQILPDHSGGPLLSLASGVDAVTRALTGRNASAAPGETSAWLQEVNFYADKDKTDTYGFRSEGFGVAGGVERGTDNGAFGVSLAFTSSDLEDPESEAEEVLSANLIELGVYWRAQGQYWTTWARAAAGYATLEATRAFVGSGLNLSNESSWNGYTLAAAGGASYERNFGRFTIRPEVYAEYFSLHEDARTETGGGDSFDLSIDERDGHMFSAVAAMNVSVGLGERSWLRPEFRIGWRQNISVDPGETIARFASGGPDFTLSPSNIEGGGPIVGFRLNVGNELGMLSITADAEMIEDYVRYMLMMRASFRF